MYNHEPPDYATIVNHVSDGILRFLDRDENTHLRSGCLLMNYDDIHPSLEDEIFIAMGAKAWLGSVTNRLAGGMAYCLRPQMEDAEDWLISIPAFDMWQLWNDAIYQVTSWLCADTHWTYDEAADVWHKPAFDRRKGK